VGNSGSGVEPDAEISLKMGPGLGKTGRGKTLGEEEVGESVRG